MSLFIHKREAVQFVVRHSPLRMCIGKVQEQVIRVSHDGETCGRNFPRRCRQQGPYLQVCTHPALECIQLFRCTHDSLLGVSYSSGVCTPHFSAEFKCLSARAPHFSGVCTPQLSGVRLVSQVSIHLISQVYTTVQGYAHLISQMYGHFLVCCISCSALCTPPCLVYPFLLFFFTT